MTIEFLFKPEAPIAVADVKTVMSGTHYFTDYTAEEQALVDAHWAGIIKTNPKAFSIPGSRATLTDSYTGEPYAEHLALAFRPTEFKTYAGTAHHEVEPMRRQIYDGMRIAAIGGAILTADGYTLIHRRPKNLTHAGGKIDASFAGLVDILDGKLQVESSVREKLKRELRLEGNDVSDIMLTGVHSGRHPDYSCMFDVRAKTSLSRSDLEKRLNKEYLDDCFFKRPLEVPAFLVENYGPGKDMLADGCAVMLANLPNELFLPTIKDLNNGGACIQFGYVKNAKFYAK